MLGERIALNHATAQKGVRQSWPTNQSHARGTLRTTTGARTIKHGRTHRSALRTTTTNARIVMDSTRLTGTKDEAGKTWKPSSRAHGTCTSIGERRLGIR